MDIANTELDSFAVDKGADKQQNMKLSSGFEEKREDRMQGLFAPFSHCMIPDPEFIRLELERSTSDQETATKVINDRYKLIMENATRRKEKEQKDKINFTQISHDVDLEKVKESSNLSHYIGIEDINKATQLLQNMHIIPDSPTKDQSEEFSDDRVAKMYGHSDLNRFIKWNSVEISTKTDISSVDLLKSVSEDHECKVDALRNMRNEQRDGEKSITFSQASQNLGSTKCKKASQIIFGYENEFIGSSFEELLDESSESLYEL
ncbi:unnamed protein product [Larinioides sclopetarius]|uniref:Uncharacterized protein n=1 Tax=Larinioides sclopetarius TaxID=280406 RepID=A0AAV1ZWX1_9ARAC